MSADLKREVLTLDERRRASESFERWVVIVAVVFDALLFVRWCLA